VLYYAFPVLASTITAETGWSTAGTTTAFSSALIISGVVGIPVGRRLDRYGPRAVMTAGSVLAVIALTVVATAPSLPWFFAGWLLVGAAMAGTLYIPAFAALTRWYGPDRVPALTTLTLVAGLASTVFAPLTAVLAEHLTWRQTYLVLALVLGALTVPAHYFGLRRPWPTAEAMTAGTVEAGGDVPDPAATARSRAFVLLAVGSALAGLTLYAAVISLVPLLQSRGLSTTSAAVALGLGGAGQVAGRLGYARFTATTTVRTRTIAVFLAGGLSTALLGLVPGPMLLLIGLSVLAGVVRGIFTLLQATAVSDRWGIHHYGRLNALISLPLVFTGAVAPAVGAGLATLLGYPAAFVVLAGISFAAAALTLTPARPAEP
jgi:MFS family permease